MRILLQALLLFLIRTGVSAGATIISLSQLADDAGVPRATAIGLVWSQLLVAQINLLFFIAVARVQPSHAYLHALLVMLIAELMGISGLILFTGSVQFSLSNLLWDYSLHFACMLAGTALGGVWRRQAYRASS